jgi:hypothetical protein
MSRIDLKNEGRVSKGPAKKAGKSALAYSVQRLADGFRCHYGPE